jgi:hypothetical protein
MPPPPSYSSSAEIETRRLRHADTLRRQQNRKHGNKSGPFSSSLSRHSSRPKFNSSPFLTVDATGLVDAFPASKSMDGQVNASFASSSSSNYGGVGSSHSAHNGLERSHSLLSGSGSSIHPHDISMNPFLQQRTTTKALPVRDISFQTTAANTKLSSSSSSCAPDPTRRTPTRHHSSGGLVGAISSLISTIGTEFQRQTLERSQSARSLFSLPGVGLDGNSERDGRDSTLNSSMHTLGSVGGPQPGVYDDVDMGTCPAEYLFQRLEARGYSTTTFKTVDTAYFNSPTPLQLASYNVHMLKLILRGHRRDRNVPETLHLTLAAGLSANACNASGESLLHKVCRRADLRLFQILLAHGADVRVADAFGRTPLHEACAAPKINTGSHQRSNGVYDDPYGQSRGSDESSTDGSALNIVERLLRIDRHLICLEDRRGLTPFRYARKEHWPAWRAFIDRIMDEIWPVRDDDDIGVAEDIASIPVLCQQPPQSRPVPDPINALPLDVARRVAEGRLDPENVPTMQVTILNDESSHSEEEGVGFSLPVTILSTSSGPNLPSHRNNESREDFDEFFKMSIDEVVCDVLKDFQQPDFLHKPRFNSLSTDNDNDSVRIGGSTFSTSSVTTSESTTGGTNTGLNTPLSMMNRSCSSINSANSNRKSFLEAFPTSTFGF